jgi:two-component sensor histidine kinase
MRLVHRVTAVVIAGLVPVIAVEIFNSIELHKSRRAEVQQYALRQAELAASEVARIVEGMQGLMTAVAQAPSVRTLNSELCVPYFQNLLARLENVSVLTAVDSSGQVRCASTSEQLKVNVADRDYFKKSQKSHGLIVGEYLIGRVSKKPALPFAFPILDASGKHIGAVISSLNLDWLSAQLLKRGIPDGGSVTIADRKGTIIARQPEPSNFVGTKIPEKYQYLLTQPTSGVIDVVSQDGTSRVLGYIPAKFPPATELYVSAGLSIQQSFTDLNAAAWRQMLITLLAVLFSIVGASILGRLFVVKPLEGLINTVHRWQAGDLDARTGLTESHGEAGKLGQEFDRTMEQLAKRQQAIDVLMKELVHRSKNQITLTISLANQLVKGQKNIDGYRGALVDRLQALSASQDLLLRHDGLPVSLEELVRTQLKSFSANTDRIHISGPSFMIGPEKARSFGMAIHELATNATKYGSLSHEMGEVKISWTISENNHDLVEFKWTESDGPVVKQPEQSGFGRTLIEKIVPIQLNGKARVSYNSSGLSWQLQFEEEQMTSDNKNATANQKAVN